MKVGEIWDTMNKLKTILRGGMIIGLDTKVKRIFKKKQEEVKVKVLEENMNNFNVGNL